MKEVRSRVRWSPQTRNFVGAFVALQTRRQSVSMFKALLNAQSHLPKNMQRPIRATPLWVVELSTKYTDEKVMSSFGDFTPEHFSLLKTTFGLAEERAQNDITEEAQIELDPSTIETSVLVSELVKRFQPSISALVCSTLQDENVRSTLQGVLLGQAVAKAEVKAPKHNPEPRKEEPRRTLYKKLLIFGLNKQVHVKEIQDEFSQYFDLRFASSDYTGRRLRSAAQAVDCVIVLTDFLSHGQTDLLVNDGSIKSTNLRGSITKLRAYLFELLRSYQKKPLDN